MPDKFRNKRKMEKQKAAHKNDHADGGMGGEYPEKDHASRGGMGGEYPEGHSESDR
jgi:hypothetical protein